MSLDILVNSCYGGYSKSKKARVLYIERLKEIDESSELFKECDGGRHDPILVQIFRELGEDFNSKHSFIEIETIPLKYKDYYSIFEYDGLERVEINELQYDADTKINKLKFLLINTMTNDEKIIEFKKILFDTEEISETYSINLSYFEQFQQNICNLWCK